MVLACSVVLRGPGHAQWLMPEDVIAPVPEVFHRYSIADLYPWDTLAGTGVVWDYAWIEVDSATHYYYSVIPLEEAPNAGDYPAANRVVRMSIGNDNTYETDHFYRVQSATMLELGSVGPVLSYVYDTPDVAYGFPMQLGDTLPNSYCFWSDGFGIQYHFCGDSYVTYDAAGTLILPFGTFADVKHVTHWRSSTETTQPDSDTSYFTRQLWFAPGMPFPILEVNFSTYSDGTYSMFGQLMDGATVATVHEIAGTTWSVAPNPTDGRLTIHRTSLAPALLQVHALDGRMVHEEWLSAQATGSVDLDALPDGPYLLRLTEDGRSSTIRVIKGSQP